MVREIPLLDSLPPGHPLHVVQRGWLGRTCFLADGDRLAYLHWLARCSRASGCVLHAYVLMGNHAHLLLTPSRSDAVAQLMRSLAARQPPGLWDARYEVSPVHIDRYVLGCMRYIELNPVRAGMVDAPALYAWSSYRSNALGRSDGLVTPHAAYYGLGRTAAGRQAAYRRLFRRPASKPAPAPPAKPARGPAPGR